MANQPLAVRAYPCQVDYLQHFNVLSQCAAHLPLDFFDYLIVHPVNEEYMVSPEGQPRGENVISVYQALERLQPIHTRGKAYLLVFWQKTHKGMHDHFSIMLHIRHKVSYKVDHVVYDSDLLYYSPGPPGPTQRMHSHLPTVAALYVERVARNTSWHYRLNERYSSFPCHHFPTPMHCLEALRLFLIELQAFSTMDSIRRNWSTVMLPGSEEQILPPLDSPPPDSPPEGRRSLSRIQIGEEPIGRARVQSKYGFLGQRSTGSDQEMSCSYDKNFPPLVSKTVANPSATPANTSARVQFNPQAICSHDTRSASKRSAAVTVGSPTTSQQLSPTQQPTGFTGFTTASVQQTQQQLNQLYQLQQTTAPAAQVVRRSTRKTPSVYRRYDSPPPSAPPMCLENQQLRYPAQQPTTSAAHPAQSLVPNTEPSSSSDHVPPFLVRYRTRSNSASGQSSTSSDAALHEFVDAQILREEGDLKAMLPKATKKPYKFVTCVFNWLIK
jgi:hypothetical protein